MVLSGFIKNRDDQIAFPLLRCQIAKKLRILKTQDTQFLFKE